MWLVISGRQRGRQDAWPADRRSGVERILADATGLTGAHSVALHPSSPCETDRDPGRIATDPAVMLAHRLCAAGPVVLALDDLQLADEATLLVWRRLCRTATQRPLLLVGACSPVPKRPELDLLRRDVRDHGGTALTVERLSDAEVAELARRITGRAPGPRLLDRLELATGNPL